MVQIPVETFAGTSHVAEIVPVELAVTVVGYPAAVTELLEIAIVTGELFGYPLALIETGKVRS